MTVEEAKKITGEFVRALRSSRLEGLSAEWAAAILADVNFGWGILGELKVDW